MEVQERDNSEPDNSDTMSNDDSITSSNMENTFIVRSVSSPELSIINDDKGESTTTISSSENKPQVRVSLLRQFDPLHCSPLAPKAGSPHILGSGHAIIEEQLENEKELKYLIDIGDDYGTPEKGSIDSQSDIVDFSLTSKKTKEDLLIQSDSEIVLDRTVITGIYACGSTDKGDEFDLEGLFLDCDEEVLLEKRFECSSSSDTSIAAVPSVTTNSSGSEVIASSLRPVSRPEVQAELVDLFHKLNLTEAVPEVPSVGTFPSLSTSSSGVFSDQKTGEICSETTPSVSDFPTDGSRADLKSAPGIVPSDTPTHESVTDLKICPSAVLSDTPSDETFDRLNASANRVVSGELTVNTNIAINTSSNTNTCDIQTTDESCADLKSVSDLTSSDIPASESAADIKICPSTVLSDIPSDETFDRLNASANKVVSDDIIDKTYVTVNTSSNTNTSDIQTTDESCADLKSASGVTSSDIPADESLSDPKIHPSIVLSDIPSDETFARLNTSANKVVSDELTDETYVAVNTSSTTNTSDIQTTDESCAVLSTLPSSIISEEKLNSPPEGEIDKTNQGNRNRIMADYTEELHRLQQEVSELKLQLNASQQIRASLELEIRQKEEVIIKTQAEELKNEQELKQLKEKLKETSKLSEKNSVKDLQEKMEELKNREAKIIDDLNQKHQADSTYQQLIEDYEQQYGVYSKKQEQMNMEFEATKQHLSNLEMAFSDVHTKYEKTKKTLIDLKQDDEVLVQSLQTAHQSNTTLQENYESIKAHAKAQIEKSNREIANLKASHDSDIAKLSARIKKYEIKVTSLETSLQQKIEENEQLSALCDEVTGKKA